MRGDHAVWCGEQGVILAGWLFIENVGAVAADLSAMECFYHVGGFDDFAAGAVEDNDPVFHFSDLGGADHAAGFIGEIAMEGDDIALGEDFVHGGAALHIMCGCELFVPVGIECDDVHAEGLRADGNFLADAAEADDAHGFVRDFVSSEAKPLALARGGGGGDDVFGDANEQAEGVLCHRGVVHAGGEKHRNVHVLGGGEVDFIEADAVFGNNFEIWSTFFQNRASDSVIATEEGIKLLLGEFEHSFFGKRASFPDNFPALGFHKFVVRAGGVLIAASGEENFHKFYSRRFKERFRLCTPLC